MLKNDLYHIEHSKQLEASFNAGIRLNEDHPIFKGHFPGQPVLPGACMLQMVKEILQEQLSQSVKLKKAMNLKFIAPIDPRLTDELLLELSYKTIENGFMVNASISANEATCFKLQAVFG